MLLPINKYFQAGSTIGSTNEQRLIEDLLIESISIYGQIIMYLPRSSVKPDMILGEDILSQFTNYFPLEMYLDNVQGWNGSNEMFTKFGITVNDKATFVVSKRRWEDTVGNQTDNLQLKARPAEGDLLYYPLTRSFFEIMFVEHLDPFYQLGKFFVYRLEAELYNYSSEPIQTGYAEIDDLALSYSRNEYTHAFQLMSGGLLLNMTGGAIILQSFPAQADAFDNTVDFQTASAGVIDFDVTNPFGDLD